MLTPATERTPILKPPAFSTNVWISISHSFGQIRHEKAVKNTGAIQDTCTVCEMSKEILVTRGRGRNRCGNCGQVGHNQRACGPQRVAVARDVVVID